MITASPKMQLILEMKNQMKAGFQSARKMVVREVDGMKSKLKEFKTAAADTFRNFTGSVMGSIPGADGLAGLLPVGGKAALIAGGIGLITAAGVESTRMSAEWNKSMAKVNVTAQLQRKELGSLSAEMRNIAGRNAGVFEDTPLAFNKIISSGLDVNRSLSLLEPTLKAAKAGFTDVETVAGAAVSVMASSGVDDATRLYDILFATLNKGNAEFQDIATYLPKIIPLARNAGISLEEVAGGFAYLTAQGFKAEAAGTGLMNVFKSFSDGRTIKGFKAIGVNLFDAEGRMRGMMPVLADLKKSMQGLTDQQRLLKFDKIGLDQEAAGALSSMLQDYEKLGGIIGFVTNSQGEFNRAIDNAATATDTWEISVNRLKGTMMQLGDILLPLVDWFSRGVGSVMDFIEWGGGKLEDGFRLLTGRQTRYQEWMSNQVDKQQSDYRSRVGARMNDERINSFVQRDYTKLYADTRAQGKGMDIRGLNDVALANIKLLEDQKATFESAIDSGSKRMKDFLKGNSIKGMDDFYRLMESGTLSGVINKMQGLLPKAQAATAPGGTSGATEKIKGGGGTGDVVSGARQQRTTIINFDSFIKGDLITQNKAIQNMRPDELLRFLQESGRRLVAGIEMGSV